MTGITKKHNIIKVKDAKGSENQPGKAKQLFRAAASCHMSDVKRKIAEDGGSVKS
jgi:hypothetical protein